MYRRFVDNGRLAVLTSARRENGFPPKCKTSTGNKFDFRPVTVAVAKVCVAKGPQYLKGLREYHRNRTGAIEQYIRVGDIVVLKEEGSARCWGTLAKVTELLKSRDNVVRSAKIQVVNTDAQRRPTVLRRAVQHLIPLEVNHSLEMLKNVDYLRSLLFKYIQCISFKSCFVLRVELAVYASEFLACLRTLTNTELEF